MLFDIQVGIVAFSTDTDVPSGTASTSDCFQTLLAKATSQNKDYLKQFVTGINHGGQTYYEKALRKAFQYFVNTPVEMNDTRDRGILHITGFSFQPISKYLSVNHNYAFRTGSVYGFGKKRRRRKRRTPTISESASNIKILHITNKAGLFHILFGLIKF